MSSFQNFKILPVIGMLVFLAACSTTKITTEANRDGVLNKVPTWYLEAEVEKYSSKVEDHLKKMGNRW